MEGLVEDSDSILEEPISPEKSEEEEMELDEEPVRSSWSASTAVLVLFATVALGWWVLHPRPGDREQIEQLVAKAKQGLETDSWVQVAECISPDYEDEGDLKKGDVAKIVQRVMRGTEKIEVTINDQQIDVGSRTAKGYFDVKIMLHEGPRSRVPIHWSLEVDFKKQRLGWYNVWQDGWVVASVRGHGIDKSFEDMF
jgi:hypothetical protein